MLASALPMPALASSASPEVADDALDFRRVFGEHIGFAARTLSNLGVVDADLEDQCQEVFLVVHRRLGEFEGRSTLRRWIYRICWRTSANYRRKHKRLRKHEADEPVEASTGAAQERELARASVRERLLVLLDGLDEERRAVFVLYELEQLSMREVTEILECPLQTGYSRLKSARKTLLDRATAMGLREEATGDE